MVRDNESCRVPGCTLHVAKARTTSITRRNDQIRDDWKSGHWNVEELSSFWGVKPLVIVNIVRRASLDKAQLVG